MSTNRKISSRNFETPTFCVGEGIDLDPFLIARASFRLNKKIFRFPEKTFKLTFGVFELRVSRVFFDRCEARVMGRSLIGNQH